MRISIRAIRLWSGIILFFYVSTHLLNLSLGLVSLSAMDSGRVWFLAVWRNPVGTVVLYGALSAHVLLTLWGLYARRSLRMHRWEVSQLVLGLLIPPILVRHIIGTRLVSEMFGVVDNYHYIMLAFTSFSPSLGVQQIVIMIIAWVHGCFGVHFWLRLKPWYAGARMWLFTGALLIPVFALLGFSQAAREIAVLLKQPGWLQATLASIRLPNEAAIAFVEERSRVAWLILLGLLVVTFAARFGRSWLMRRKGLVRLIYPGPQNVDVSQGTSVLEASRLAGIPHASVCGGRGRCSTCRIRIGKSEVALPVASEEESKVLARVGAAPGVRLACQLRPAPGRLEVTPLLPPTATARDAVRRPAYLQGREEDIAVLFADLRSFTKFSEKKLPFDVVFVLNRYFSTMGVAVEDAGGHVDKFIGDGVMALFGIGSNRQQGCREALSAARAMSEGLKELNRSLEHDLNEPLRIGIGIHAGPAIVGEMGYGQATNLTAIGDTVNTASRLETMTKKLGAQLVVSEIVGDYAGIDLTGLHREEVSIRGREQPLKVRFAETALDLPVTGVRAKRRRTARHEEATAISEKPER
jgi:adenylate cyclase